MPDPKPRPNHCEGFSPAPQESSKARQEPEAPTCSSELDFSYDDGESGIWQTTASFRRRCTVTLFPGRCASQSALRFKSRRAHSCAGCCAVASAELSEVSRCDDGLWPRARPWRVTPE
ncbi:hypothetical protein MRX96_001105 [Rhipicephalus microplus]